MFLLFTVFTNETLEISNINKMNYRYILDRTSKKHTCPSCSKKRFVRYVDIESNKYLSDVVGRCDRENSCGYHYKPKDYFQRHPNQPLNTFFINKTTPPPKTDFIPLSVYQFYNENTHEYHFEKCGFINFLMQVFRNSKYILDYQGTEIPFEVARIITDYKITAANKTWVADGLYDDAVIFWQFDVNQQIRTGKIMRYNAENGKRIKHPVNYINWVHGVYKRQKKVSFNLHQCFFGEHLLMKYPNRKVAIVESEKTACIMSQIKPNLVWLATGGSNGAKWRERSVYKALLNREVILYPDLGQLKKWSEIATMLNSVDGISISVSKLLEFNVTQQEIKNGFDILDYALFNQWNLYQTSDSMI